MTSDELFLTVHPEPQKQGVRIDKAKYDIVRDAILFNLQRHGALTFTQLGVLVDEQLRHNFIGSVMWYYTTVKLDMEARGEIRRASNSRPQVVEIA